MITSEILKFSTQVNNGLTDTSGDGVSLAFDKKFGIMFCVYMPGPQGRYGESRGRISLSYFPASQPTNIRFVDISCDKDVYVPNILSLGDGRVRIFYEKDSKSDCDHETVWRDFDFRTGELTEETQVMLKREDGNIVPLNTTEQFTYLEKRGFHNHTYLATEQIVFGASTFFDRGDGYIYGTLTSYLAEPILYRSNDNLETLEFFAVCPYTAQYEADYKIVDGKIYLIFRTNKDIDSIGYTTSDDMGKTWSEAVYFKDSIQCRPRAIVSQGKVIFSYNYFNTFTANRPAIQQGRTSVCMVSCPDMTKRVDLWCKSGIVNVSLCDVLGDVYLAYSSSPSALEYHNGNPLVRGKDSVRYVRLGDLFEE